MWQMIFKRRKNKGKIALKGHFGAVNVLQMLGSRRRMLDNHP
jgi:hypothetical protein